MSQLTDIINQINSLTGYNVPTSGLPSASQVPAPQVPPVINYAAIAPSGTISTYGILPGSIIKSDQVLRIINALNGISSNLIIVSGSLVTSGSNVFNGSLSLPFISNDKLLHTSGGYVVGVDYPTGSQNAVSASYAITASYAMNGGGGSTDTGSLLTTASVSLNTITFTKGDGSTFPITVDTGSGGITPTLQEVLNTGNGVSNYGGIGSASIQSTNFTNNRTLYLNDNTYPTIRLVDNINASNFLQIDIDTLNIDGTSYNWSSIVNPPTTDTGSFATTGSNTFYGLQTLTASEADLSALDIHAKDDRLWTFRTYNDAYSPTLIGLASWIDNTGISFLGTETDKPLYIYSNAQYYQPTLVVSSSGVTINKLIVNDGITGSLEGTASWANNVINAQTASNILGGKAAHVPFFKTDTTLATSSIYQSGSSTVIINQDAATTANPEALYVWQPSTTSFNVISGKGNLNSYLQLNIQNTNQGTNASSDVVATAGSGNESINYIDMGINSDNFSGDIGGPNDAYLYSTGQSLHIGNATAGQPVQFFAGGADTEVNKKLELNANGQHNMTGSLTVSQGVTASLYGNASTADFATNATNATNAGYATNAGNATTADTATEAVHAQTADYATNAGNGGVTNIVPGSGITLIPANGQGSVTVIASGGGGTTIISGSNVTGSFLSNTTWTFNHNLGTRTPIITVFDSNYNQIIPQNIELTNTSSATITFPTAESGFAVASLGGTTGTVLSSSYSLFSTYANTASYYAETDPVFVAKSGSYATTASLNSFTASYKTDSSSFNNRIGSLTNATSSYVLASQTSSMSVATASYVKNAQTASYYVETDPIFVAKSASLATTGSNTFRGNQIVTGSLFTSGSNTLIGSTTLTGSLNVSGSTIQTGNNTLTGNTVLSGSISVSGSQTFKGSLDLTGSLTVSGSTTQVGNNTLTGKTTLSGSIIISGSTTNEIIGNTEVIGEFNVSGSSIFRNSTFTVTGSTFVKGETNISGSTNITGSLNVTGNVNVVSGSSFTRWGNKLFNYGAFSDYTTQSGSADTAYSVKFNTTDVALGIELSGSSAIKIENKGIYNFQWSGQLHQGANGSIVSIWLKINGVDVPGSRGDVTLASNDDALPAWNYVLPFNAGDAVELYWSSTRSTTTWVFSPAATTPTRPSTASILATLTQIA